MADGLVNSEAMAGSAFWFRLCRVRRLLKAPVATSEGAGDADPVAVVAEADRRRVEGHFALLRLGEAGAEHRDRARLKEGGEPEADPRQDERAVLATDVESVAAG